MGFPLHGTGHALDGGTIFLQNCYQPVRGDTTHYTACRTTVALAHFLAQRLSAWEGRTIPAGIKQKTTGRLFLTSDWRPEHLRLVYDLYDAAGDDALLDGEIHSHTVQPIDVFAS